MALVRRLTGIGGLVGVVLGLSGCPAPTTPIDSGRDTSIVDTSDTSTTDTYTETGETGTYTGVAPEITSATVEDGYTLTITKGEEVTYPLTILQDPYADPATCSSDSNDSTLRLAKQSETYCGPFAITGMEVGDYVIHLATKDNFGEDFEDLQVVVVEPTAEPVYITSTSNINGTTENTLSGSAAVSGPISTTKITLDSALEEYINTSSATLSGTTVNYSLGFNNDIDWSVVGVGYVSGSGSLEVCNVDNVCDYQTFDVTAYAPSQVTVNVRSPFTVDTSEFQRPLSATVTLECDSGENYELSTDSATGLVTAYLNSSNTACTLTADAGSDYAYYAWNHSFASGEEDDAGIDLNGVLQLEPTLDLYQNFTPSDYDSGFDSDCYDGLLSSSRNLLLVGNGMVTTTGRDTYSRTFERYNVAELDDTIAYWVSETNLSDHSTTSSENYDSMYTAVIGAMDTMNSDNPMGYTFFEEATSLSDGAYIVYWGASGNTSTGCQYNSESAIETYGTSYFCSTSLRTASSRTVMEEMFNTISTDLCGDSISSGGSSFTNLDWFVWNTINFSHYQNIMERTE